MNTLIVTITIFIVFVIGITRIIVYFAKRFGKNISPYLIFGIVDILSGLVVLGLAILDFTTIGGDLNGILGQLALMIFEPTVIVLLIADLIIWRKKTCRVD